MKWAARTSWVLSAVLLLQGGWCWAQEDAVVGEILKARSEVKVFANPASRIADLDVAKAYALQSKLVKAIVAQGDKVSGFKAGLTSKATQGKFGVDAPVLAPLFASGSLRDGATVETKDFVKLFIETEVGYVTGQRIDASVPDVATLKKLITAVAPAVELPDLRFGDMKAVKGPDIIADAVGSAKYLIGKPVPADQVDVTSVQVTLKLNGQEVNKGDAKDALGDQWQALLWLVNGALKEGYTIEPGQVFITGALGNMIPGKPGPYEGDWGPLGTLSFTVK